MKHGKYSGKIVDACVGKTAAGALRVELLLGTEDGQTCCWTGGLVGNGFAFTMSTLKFYGLKDGQGPDSLIGKDCEWTVGTRTGNNGQEFEDIKLHAYSGLITKESDRLKGKDAAAILFPPAYSPPALRGQRDREPGDDSDMPF